MNPENQNEFRISELIGRHLAGTLSEEDNDILQAWINENEDNSKLFHQITNPDKVSEKIKRLEEINIEKGWDVVKASTFTQKRITLVKVLKYAAVIILPLLAGYFWYVSTEKMNDLNDNLVSGSFVPGTQKATLKLSNGTSIELGKEIKGEVKDVDGKTILLDSTTVKYDKVQVKALAYNVLTTPRGGEYKVVLDDGTVVHLNCDSELRYPVSFVDSVRTVYLKGEAYFEVAKAKKAFIVKTSYNDIVVHGTHFNVHAYEDESFIQTTLTEGSVSVAAEGQEVFLKPGQQSSYNIITGDISKKEVRTSVYTSWLHGEFRFEDASLLSVLNTCSRWYDFKIQFEDEKLKNIKMSGKVDRFKDFSVFSKMIEKTAEVKMSKKDNIVIVSFN